MLSGEKNICRVLYSKNGIGLSQFTKVLKQFSNFAWILWNYVSGNRRGRKISSLYQWDTYVVEHRFIQSLIYTKQYHSLSEVDKKNIS